MDYLGGAQPYDTTTTSSSSYLTASTQGTRFVGRVPVARGRVKTLTIVHPHAVSRGEALSLTRQKFKKLAKDWRSATQMESSPVAMATHPSYQRIIALGEPALPLVIEELRVRGGHWFWALRFLADYDPVPREAKGDYNRMRELWLNWWDKKGR